MTAKTGRFAIPGRNAAAGPFRGRSVNHLCAIHGARPHPFPSMRAPEALRVRLREEVSSTVVRPPDCTGVSSPRQTLSAGLRADHKQLVCPAGGDQEKASQGVLQALQQRLLHDTRGLDLPQSTGSLTTAEQTRRSIMSRTKRRVVLTPKEKHERAASKRRKERRRKEFLDASYAEAQETILSLLSDPY